jgi:flagellar biosynthesis protein FliR
VTVAAVPDLIVPGGGAHLILVAARTAGALLLAPVFDDWALVGGLAAAELGVGALLGWTASLVIHAARTAGQMMDHEMSFLGVQPDEGEEGGLMACAQALLATLIYVLVDGPQIFLSGLYGSFGVWPAGGGGPSMGWGLGFAASALASVLEIALRIAAPIVLAGILMSLALALVARFAPSLPIGPAAFGTRSFALMAVFAAAFGGIVALLSGSVGAYMEGWSSRLEGG